MLKVYHIIRYPATISNVELYRRCDTEPISAIACNMRIRLLGHVLRLDESVPANMAMKEYFETAMTMPKRSRMVTIATRTQDDLAKVGVEFQNIEDLKSIRKYAEDRSLWRYIGSTIFMLTLKETLEYLNEKKRRRYLSLENEERRKRLITADNEYVEDHDTAENEPMEVDESIKTRIRAPKPNKAKKWMKDRRIRYRIEKEWRRKSAQAHMRSCEHGILLWA